ncbi:hypothetical protein KI387_027395, partial [Taxus chinensis]
PSVPDNADHWQVFNDDNKILAFLEQRDNFNNLFFEGSVNPHREVVAEDASDEIERVDDEGMIRLKGNKIPKGLVSLEDLFDKHDRFIHEKEKLSSRHPSNFDKENIGTSEDPRMVNIGKCCSPEEKRKFIAFLKKYSD